MLLPLLLVVALIQACFAPVSAFVQLPSFRSRRAFGLAQGKNLSPIRSTSSDDAPAITTSPERPIVVIGAGGKTGRIITQILADQKQYVRAVDRSERTLDNVSKASEKYVSCAVGDVTSYGNILSVLQQGAAGVIWAVTSSGVKQGGGDVVEVDYKGAYYTAKACLACNVPKLAFISAGCVTRPNSLGSKAVNMVAKLSYGDIPWVDAKMAGEAAVRDLYKARNKKNVAYVIVRPTAALSNNPPIRVDELLVMQGDVYSSATSISRTNVAHIVISALLKGKATDFVTFEVCPAVRLYENDKGNVLDLFGLPTMKQTTIPDLPKPLVHRNAFSYGDLLDGLVTDEDMLKQYGSIVSDYRGEGVPSVEEFA